NESCARRLSPYTHSPRRITGSARSPAPNPIDIDLARSDHEVDVNRAAVAACTLERVIVHGLCAGHRELVRSAERGVAGGVLVEERVVEQASRLGNRGTARRDARNPDAVSAHHWMTPRAPSLAASALR